MAVITNTIRWADDTAQLKQRLAEGIGTIDAMKSSVDRTAASLGGQGLFRAANNAAAAIQQVGGVTKLTAAEQEKANILLTKAIEKYQVMGMKVPPEMQAIADATKRVSTETGTAAAKTTTWSDQLSGLARAIGITFSVAAVVGFAKELLRLGDEIVRVADRTGLTTDEVQRLSYVAGQSGNSIDELTGAIGQMQNRLASGDKSAVASVKELGLNFQALMAASPAKQLEMIATEIAKIPDPADRTRIAMDLFGKTGTAILPTLTAQFATLAAQAPVMSRETVQGLDAAGDALNRFKSTIKVWAAESYNWLRSGFETLIIWVYKAQAAILDTTAATLTLIAKLPGGGKALAALGIDIGSVTKTAQWYRDAAGQMAVATDTAAGSTTKFNPIIRTTSTELTAAAKAAKAYNEALQAQYEEFSGAKLLAQGEMYVRTLMEIGGSSKLTAGETETMRKVFEAIIEKFKQLGPEGRNVVEHFQRLLAIERMLTAEGGTVVVSIGKIADEIGKKLRPEVWALEAEGARVFQKGLPAWIGQVGTQLGPEAPVSRGLKDFKKQLGSLSTSLANLAQVSGGAFGDIARDLATLVSAFDTAIEGQKSFAAGLKAFKAGDTLAGIAGMATGILGIASAAISAGKAIYNLFFGETAYEKRIKAAAVETQKLRDSLIATYGSMQKMVEAADMVGIAIMEAFKSKDPVFLKTVIDDLNNKTKKLSAAMEEYGFTWEDTAQRFRQSKMAEMFETLWQKTQLLVGVGIDYSEILRRQAGDYSALVQASIRTGTEIPAALKPVLQDLVKMGLLVDASGQAFTDLEGLTFAQTLTQGFDRVVDKLDELIDKLTRGVGGALDDLGRRVVVIPIRFAIEGQMPDPFQNFPTRTAHSGAFVTAAGIERMHGGSANILPFKRAVVAHGGLAADEVPAILQVGESVLTRTATRALGVETIRALNRGGGGGQAGGSAVSLRGLEEEVKALRADLRRQHVEAQADRQFMARTLPKAIKAAIQRGAA